MDYKEALNYYETIKKLSRQLGAVYFPNIGFIDFSQYNPDLSLEDFLYDVYKTYFSEIFLTTGKPILASDLLQYIHDTLSLEYKKRVEENLGAKFTETARDASGNFLVSMGLGLQYAVFDVAPELFAPLTLGISQFLADRLKNFGIADEFATTYNWYMTNKTRIQVANAINKRISSLPDELIEGWINYRGVGGAMRTLGNLVGFMYGYSKLINGFKKVLGHTKWGRKMYDLLQATGQGSFAKNLAGELIGFGVFDTIGATFDPYRKSFIDIGIDIIQGEKVDGYAMKEAIMNIFTVLPSAMVSTSFKHLDKFAGIILKKTPLSKLRRQGIENQVESLITPSEFLARNIVSQTLAYPLFVGYEMTIRGSDYLLSKLYGLHGEAMILPSIEDSMLGAGIITGLNLFLTGAIYPKYKRHFLDLMGRDFQKLEAQAQGEVKVEGKVEEAKGAEVKEEAKAEVKPQEKFETELTPQMAQELEQGRKIIDALEKARKEREENFGVIQLAELYASYDVRFPYGRGIHSVDDVNLIKSYAEGEFLMKLVGAYNTLLYKVPEENAPRLYTLYSFIKELEQKLAEGGSVVKLYEGEKIKSVKLPPIWAIQVGGVRFEYKDVSAEFRKIENNKEFIDKLIIAIDDIIVKARNKSPYEIYLSDNILNYKNKIESFLNNPVEWAKNNGFSTKRLNLLVLNEVVFQLNRLFEKIHNVDKIYTEKQWDKRTQYKLGIDIGIIKVKGQPLYFYIPLLKVGDKVEFNPVSELVGQKKVKLLSELKGKGVDIGISDNFTMILGKEERKKFEQALKTAKESFQDIIDLEDIIKSVEAKEKIEWELKGAPLSSEEITELETRRKEYVNAIKTLYTYLEAQAPQIKNEQDLAKFTQNFMGYIYALFNKIKKEVKNKKVRRELLKSFSSDLEEIMVEYEKQVSNFTKRAQEEAGKVDKIEEKVGENLKEIKEEIKEEIQEEARKEVDETKLWRKRYNNAVKIIYSHLETQASKITDYRDLEQFTNKFVDYVYDLYGKIRTEVDNESIKLELMKNLLKDLQKFGQIYEKQVEGVLHLTPRNIVREVYLKLGDISDDINLIFSIKDLEKQIKEVASGIDLIEAGVRVRNNLKELVKMAQRDYELRRERAELDYKIKLKELKRHQITEARGRIKSIDTMITRMMRKAEDLWYEIKKLSSFWKVDELSTQVVNVINRDIQRMVFERKLGISGVADADEEIRFAVGLFYDYLDRIIKGTKKLLLPKEHPFVKALSDMVAIGFTRVKGKKQKIKFSEQQSNLDYIKDKALEKLFDVIEKEKIKIEKKDVEVLLDNVMKNLNYYEGLIDLLKWFRDNRKLRGDQIIFYPRQIIKGILKSGLPTGKMLTVRFEGEQKEKMVWETQKFSAQYAGIETTPTLDDIVDYVVEKTKGRLLSSSEIKVVSLEEEFELEEGTVKRQIADENAITEDEILNAIDEAQAENKPKTEEIIRERVEEPSKGLNELIKTMDYLKYETEISKEIKKSLAEKGRVKKEKLSGYVYNYIANYIENFIDYPFWAFVADEEVYKKGFYEWISEVSDEMLDKLKTVKLEELSNEERGAIDVLLRNLAIVFSVRPLYPEEVGLEAFDRRKSARGYMDLFKKLLEDKEYNPYFVEFLKRYSNFMFELGVAVKDYQEKKKYSPPRKKLIFDVKKYTNGLIELLNEKKLKNLVLKYNLNEFLQFLFGLSNLALFSPLVFMNDDLYRDILKQIFDIDDEVRNT